jgi:hypothetical protein
LKKTIVIVSVLAAALLGYFFIPGYFKAENKKTPVKNEAKVMPKVLFMTSGIDEGSGYIAEGVTVAIQTFCKKGIFVWLDNRDVILEPEILSEYSVIVMPTSVGYNDGDRKYSLTFLSDFEMENIKNWVNNGGILITEENIGRNHSDGTDRVDANGELNESNWKFSELFGFKMKEIDMNGFALEETSEKIWNAGIKEKSDENEWMLIPTDITSGKIKILGEWIRDNEKIPAITCNEFGKGKAYFFTTTYILHPSNAGGVSSIEQIENFYDYVIKTSGLSNKFEVEINPWPSAYTTAFCAGFNSAGNPDQYRRLNDFLKTENLHATLFADSSVNTEELDIIKGNKDFNIQSGLFSGKDISESNYSEAVQEIVMNEQHFGNKFSGLRFPFQKTNFWGLIYADEKGYKYESSVGIDHLTGYEGSVFPYNIPVSQNSFYKTLNMLEISPANGRDENYFPGSINDKDYTEEDQRTDAQLFSRYLLDFYEFVTGKYNGLIVYSGSPGFTAFSEITLQPLKKLVDTLRTNNCWITGFDEVTSFRNSLKDLTVGISESGNEINLTVRLPKDAEIKGLTFRMKSKPAEVKTTGSNNVKEIKGLYYLITDVKDGDTIKLEF